MNFKWSLFKGLKLSFVHLRYAKKIIEFLNLTIK